MLKPIGLNVQALVSDLERRVEEADRARVIILADRLFVAGWGDADACMELARAAINGGFRLSAAAAR